MTHDVFISYSSKDKLAAEAACAVLEAKGVRCWIAPRDIPPGANWAATISDTIGGCRVFLLIFSNNANASEQVQREVDLAANHRLSIIPLRIENTLPQRSLEYYLNQRHWLDAFTPPLEQHLNRLAEAIGLLLGGDAAPATAEIPQTIWAAQPRERKSFGPYLLGAAALLSVALVAFGWVAFHRDAPPAPQAGPAAASPNADLAMTDATTHKATVIYPRAAQCAATPAGDTKFCVSSMLASQHDAAGVANAYGPQNLFDDNPATAWCEGVAGPGNGQEITVEFARAVIVSQISVVNGYAKSEATFAKNNSVHTLTAIWPDETTTALDLGDSMTLQAIATGHDAPVRRLRLRIDTVNGGSKWPDTCISELKFDTREP
jgi:hypothetical protein